MTVKISAKDVKKLRDLTGAGMMDCKKALNEAEGDFDAAIEALRKKGQKLSAKRADRSANEGVALAVTSEDYSKGIALTLNCETDFVAKNDDFVNLAKELANIALENFPADLEGLLALPYDGKMSIAEKIEYQTGVVGEKLEIAKYACAQGGMVVPYIHAGYRLGVLLKLNKKDDAYLTPGKDVAMQVAAMNPIAVNQDGVDQTVIEKEIEIGMEVARNEGKPENLLEKIAKGKLSKFFKENTLLNQDFVKDNKMSVAKYLQSIDKELTVESFNRIALS